MLRIQGGRPLTGRIRVSGAKNAALPALAATLLTAEPVVLDDVPDVADVRTMIRLLATIGVPAGEAPGGGLRIHAGSIAHPVAPWEIVRTMRASSLVLGPLLARTGEARVSLPGGCAIGSRPMDLHVAGLEALGAKFRMRDGYLEGAAPRGLTGARFAFPRATVTGAEDLMMAAALASGETVIENAAREPEVVDLAALLRGMGAKISGAGTSTIRIAGAGGAGLGGTRHRLIPDRIEAGTLLAAGALVGENLRVEGIRGDHLGAVLEALRAAGAAIEADGDGAARISAARLRPVDVVTGEFPGFPTDMQAQWMALSCFSAGDARIVETIFENRFAHAAELRRMGARIGIEGRRALVRGGAPLAGTRVMASDLRAGAALVVAGLAARGETEVHRLHHLDRGYERLDRKLAEAGADIRRVQIG